MKRFVVVFCLAMLFPRAVKGQITVASPSVEPSAITAGISTAVSISVLIPPSNLPVLANGVNVLQVNSDGSNPRVIATLNDQGQNGDITAGDNFFGGTSTLYAASPGIIYLQISTAFKGTLRRKLSSVVAVIVAPVGVPTSPAPMNLLMIEAAPDTGESIACNELLVTFQPRTSSDEINSLVSSVGGRIVGMLPAFGIYEIGFDVCDTNALNSVRAQLRSSEAVASAEFDGVNVTQSTFPDDPLYPDQWGLVQVNAPGAWAIAQKGVPIGIIDTGVNYNHEDLTVTRGIDFCSSVNSDGTCVLSTDPMDYENHGTAVAGVAAAITNNGVEVASPAFNTSVIAEKIFPPPDAPCGAQCSAAFDSTVLTAAEHAIYLTARVINLSFGRFKPSETISNEPVSHKTTYQDLVDYASAKGAVITAAAGNYLCGSKEYIPAATQGIISVGASDANDGLSVWNSSAPTCDDTVPAAQEPGSNYGNWVTVYAPGTNIEVLMNSPLSPYSSGNGTSFAAPLVAGVVSLMLGASPSLTLNQVSTLITCTADIVGLDPAGNVMRRLNMSRAVQFAASGKVSCPVTVGVLFQQPPVGDNSQGYYPVTGPGSAWKQQFVASKSGIVSDLTISAQAPSCGGTPYSLTALLYAADAQGNLTLLAASPAVQMGCGTMVFPFPAAPTISAGRHYTWIVQPSSPSAAFWIQVYNGPPPYNFSYGLFSGTWYNFPPAVFVIHGTGVD